MQPNSKIVATSPNCRIKPYLWVVCAACAEWQFGHNTRQDHICRCTRGMVRVAFTAQHQSARESCRGRTAVLHPIMQECLLLPCCLKNLYMCAPTFPHALREYTRARQELEIGQTTSYGSIIQSSPHASTTARGSRSSVQSASGSWCMAATRN